MSVLLSLIPSVIGTGVGLAQQSKLRKDLAEKQKQAEGQFDRSLQAIRDISFDPSQELRAARMSQLEAGRAIGDMAAQRTDEAQARAIAALRDSPRALQSAGTRVIDSALDAQQQADVAGTQQTLAGELGMAQDAEKARMQALQRDLSLEQMLMNRAAQAGDVAEQGIFASRAGGTETIQALGNLGTQALLMDDTAEKGGYIGEQGGMTEGEFDHDTNKKAIVDEENGQKEGELTGGEMVFNPEQTDGITTLVEKGDAEALLMFLRDLLSQPQFQEA